MIKNIITFLIFSMLAVLAYHGGQNIPHWDAIFIIWLIIMIGLGITSLILDRVKKKLEEIIKNKGE